VTLQKYPIKRISVIVPMLNEAEHIDGFVDDLAAQDVKADVEIYVADGGSVDGSPELLEAAARRAGLSLHVRHNPARRASAGLNVCLLEATGDLIVRLDCHSRYPPDYLRRCAVASEETGAWNVGGLFEPVARTTMERAAACALESPFGGHNWARHRKGTERVEVDTVYCGAFRPETFARVGLYDESLAVVEVEDLNLRIRKAGGRVVYDPSIRIWYLPRGSLKSTFVQYYRYGLWKVPVMLKHRQVLTGRSQVPLVFVISLVVLAAASVRARRPSRLLVGELALYGTCALGFAIAAVRKRREDWRLVPRAAVVFPTFHLAHGLGGIHGWLRVAATVDRWLPRHDGGHDGGRSGI
jgi:succinoglycan biosynthesis protein ExoA